MKDLKIIKSKVLNATKETVYQSLINPDDIIQYYPLQEVVSDWVVGSTIRYIGEQSGVDEGVIDVLDHNHCFQFTYWNPKHDTENKKENHITVSYVLETKGSQTLLTLCQSNLPSERYFQIMNSVWDSLLESFRVFTEKRTR